MTHSINNFLNPLTEFQNNKKFISPAATKSTDYISAALGAMEMSNLAGSALLGAGTGALVAGTLALSDRIASIAHLVWPKESPMGLASLAISPLLTLIAVDSMMRLSKFLIKTQTYTELPHYFSWMGAEALLGASLMSFVKISYLFATTLPITQTVLPKSLLACTIVSTIISTTMIVMSKNGSPFPSLAGIPVVALKFGVKESAIAGVTLSSLQCYNAIKKLKAIQGRQNFSFFHAIIANCLKRFPLPMEKREWEKLSAIKKIWLRRTQKKQFLDDLKNVMPEALLPFAKSYFSQLIMTPERLTPQNTPTFFSDTSGISINDQPTTLIGIVNWFKEESAHLAPEERLQVDLENRENIPLKSSRVRAFEKNFGDFILLMIGQARKVFPSPEEVVASSVLCGLPISSLGSEIP